jgi:hypothetical protein
MKLGYLLFVFALCCSAFHAGKGAISMDQWQDDLQQTISRIPEPAGKARHLLELLEGFDATEDDNYFFPTHQSDAHINFIGLLAAPLLEGLSQTAVIHSLVNLLIRFDQSYHVCKAQIRRCIENPGPTAADRAWAEGVRRALLEREESNAPAGGGPED